MTSEKGNVRFWAGNEACAEGALYAGCRFFAGYPITPSSEVAEHLAERLPQVGGVFMQMEDEIAAMAAVIGASLAGKKALTATSGPGFSLKQENIGYACITEVPCVIVNVQRGGPSTGFPTGPSQADVMQARWGTHGDHPVIALSPASVEESFTEMVRAFNLSERFRTPVIFLSDEIIGHLREKTWVPAPGELEIYDRVRPTVSPEEYLPYRPAENDIPPMANFGEGYRFHVTGLNHDETGFPTNEPALIEAEGKRLLRKVERGLTDILRTEEFMLDDAEVAVVTFGSGTRSARRAVRMARERGVKAGMFRLLTVWPFPEAQMRAVAEQVRKVVVVELNLGQLILEVERAVHGLAPVVGVQRANIEPIHPDLICSRILE